MSYKDFTIKKVQRAFEIEITERVGIFSGIGEKTTSEHLAETLKENIPLATSINTEKARSELIIAPILVELRKIFNHKISLFSGIELNVDKDKELNGFFSRFHAPAWERILDAPASIKHDKMNTDRKRGQDCIPTPARGNEKIKF